MPLFFFDLDDGEAVLTDNEGSDHVDLAAAQVEAAETLSLIARAIFPKSTSRAMSIEIRTESGVSAMWVRLKYWVERAVTA